MPLGDTDDDGRGDFLISASSSADAGSYLVTAAALDLADAADGAVDGDILMSNIVGIAGSFQFKDASTGVGTSLQAVGDIDGDGYGNFLFGHPLLIDVAGFQNLGGGYLLSAAEVRTLDALDGAQDGAVSLENFDNTTTAVSLTGTSRADRLLGRLGDDMVTGLDGDDVLIGADGNDTLNGGDGQDTLDGGQGADEILGGANGDIVFAGNGDDVVDGGSGADTANGGKGDDVLKGRKGTDVLNSGNGDDKLVGGGGGDVLNGGKGSDILKGGGGKDVFEFTATKESSLKRSDDIVGFKSSRGDLKDLSGIDAAKGAGNQAFSFIGDDAFSGAKGELRIEDVGKHFRVLGDSDGDGTPILRSMCSKSIA